MGLWLALVILLIPLAIAPGWFFYFDVTPKIVVLLLGTAGAVVWWAAKGGARGFYRSSGAARWFVFALCAMAVSLTISTATSVQPVLSLAGSSWRYWGLVVQLAAMGYAYLAAAWSAGTPERLRTLLRAVAGSGLAAGLYAIAQYSGWDAWLDARRYHVGEGVWAIVRPPSTLGHADYAANWLLFSVFAAFALGGKERKVWWKRLAWGAAAVGTVGMVCTGSRAALLGLVVGVAFMTALTGHRLPMRHLKVAGVAGAVAFVLYLSPAGERMRARVHWALSEPAGGARILLWRDSVRMASSRLPTGYGPETFLATFALHQSAELGRAFPDFYHESPHNIFLDALVSQGVGGMLLLAALAGSGFAAFWSVRGDVLAGALAAGLAGMTISEQFSVFTMPTALAYYTMVAMLVSLSVSSPVEARAGKSRWPGLAFALACAGVLVFAGVRMAMAETALADVRRDVDAGHVGDAASRYADYERWRWPGASADLWYSRRLAQVAAGVGDPTARAQAFQYAGMAAERATQSSDASFNAYYNLAAFYARENDFIRTEQSLRAAIYRGPNWFKTHWMLAQVLQAGGRLREAETEAGKAVELDGGKHAEVTATADRIHAAVRGPAPVPAHK